MYIKKKPPCETYTGPSIPVVIITTAKTPTSTKQDATFVISGPDIEAFDTLNPKPIEIATIGQSSAGFPKKQWKIKFDTKQYIGSIPSKSKKFILQGPYLDKSLLRNNVLYDLARDIGIKAPYTQLVEVLLNTSGEELNLERDYWGIYILIEKIEVANDKVDISPSDYLFKFDKSDPDDMGLTFVLPKVNSNDSSMKGLEFQIVEPEPDTLGEQENIVTGLKLILSKFQNILYSDNINVNDLINVMDIDSFINGFIITELSANSDAYKWSTFLYTKNNKIFIGPYWDQNLSLKNTLWGQNLDIWSFKTSLGKDLGTVVVDTSSGMQQVPVFPGLAVWYNRLLEIPGFKNRLIDRFSELEKTVININKINMVLPLYASLVNSTYYLTYKGKKLENIKPFFDYNVSPAGNAQVTTYGIKYKPTTPVNRNFTKWNILQSAIFPITAPRLVMYGDGQLYYHHLNVIQVILTGNFVIQI